MSLMRGLIRLLFGRRLPRTEGKLVVKGITSSVRIRRDKWGIPVIETGDDADAWFGLGFCHGQDRAGQLEGMKRLASGTLAEWVGPDALPLDRVARRVGFRRSAEEQLPLLTEVHKSITHAYVAGVNAGRTLGHRRRPLEFALIGGQPTPLDEADVFAVLKLQSFLLVSNWAMELARLRILSADGPEALADLEPSYPSGLPVASPPGAKFGSATVDRLASDLSLFTESVPLGGGSNNWAIAGSRTATGRSLLANDPHLAPILPMPWYLAHLRTPEWSLCGASFVGTPSFPIAHNGRAAWGVTAGLVDDTDLFLEEIGPDGMSVREGDTFVPCEVFKERIKVRGQEAEWMTRLQTPRGPIVSSALEGVPEALSLSATWLQQRPIRGWFDAHQATNFDEFRHAFSDWPALSQNLVYTDTSGDIGWQLCSAVPVRKRGFGLVPLAGWNLENGWKPDSVPFEEMPFAHNPSQGWIATANTPPLPDGEGPFLGADFLEGYRLDIIGKELSGRTGWTLEDCQRLQMNVTSRPWQTIRDVVLRVTTDEPDTQTALDLLREWDGEVSSDSPAATVFEFFMTELGTRVVYARAPLSAERALGVGFWLAGPENHFGMRRTGRLCQLIPEQPEGWFTDGWESQIKESLGKTISVLRKLRGERIMEWGWGEVRPIRFRHLLFGEVRRLRTIFNRETIGYGDENTPCQAAGRKTDATLGPTVVPSLRAVFDAGEWSNSRFALAGGQSGNPYSSHYDDLLHLWQQGNGVPIAWTTAEVDTATIQELVLESG